MDIRLKKGIILFSLLIFPLGMLFSQTQEASRILEQNKEGVLSLVAYGEDKTEAARGSGFAVMDNEIIVTCYDLVSNAYTVEGRNFKGKKIKVEGIITVNRDLNIALLKIKGKIPSLSLGNSDKLEMGNRIFALGGKEGKDITVSEGTIMNFMEFKPGQRVVKASLSYKEGFSGGPLLGLKGEVLGVTVDLGKGLQFIIPVNRVKPLIKRGKIVNFKNWKHENYLSSHQGAFLAGRLFLLLDEPGKARLYLEKVVKANPNNIEAYADLASANAQLRYFESAISAYKKIIQLDPNREDAHYGLGLVYLKIPSRQRDAISPLKKAIELNPRNIDAYYQLGNAYEELREFEKAVEMYKGYLSLNPESTWAGYLRLGVCTKEIGQYEETIKAFQEALKEKPDDVSINLKLAETYQIAEQYDNAAEAYRKLAEINPDEATAYYGMVVKMYDGIGMFEKAIEAANKIVEFNPDSELAVYNLGIMYSKLEKYDDAIKTFRKALTINPNYDIAYYNIGLNYFNLKKFKEAVDAFKNFVEITPDNADAWYNIGVGYMQIKNFEAALHPLRKSIELRPDYGLALYNLAICYLNLKDSYSARDVYKKLVNIDPDLANKLKKHLR